MTDTNNATFRVVGDKQETDSPVAETTTSQGDILQGIYVADKAMTMDVAACSCRQAGQSQYFVRIKHVIRPQGAVALLSRGVVFNGVEAGPLTKAEARKFVLDVGARNGVNFGTRVDIFNAPHNLPTELFRKTIRQGWVTGGDERLFGAFHKGVVYVVASEHNSAKQVEETVFHEVCPMLLNTRRCKRTPTTPTRPP